MAEISGWAEFALFMFEIVLALLIVRFAFTSVSRPMQIYKRIIIFLAVFQVFVAFILFGI